MDIGRHVPKALLDGIKARKRAKQGKMGRPDMGGDQHGLRAGLQGNLHQVPAVQAQNGPSVRVQVADGLQPEGELLRRLQGGQQDHIMNLAGAPVLFVDGADFPGYHKARSRLPASCNIRQPPVRLQPVKAFFRRFHRLRQQRPPGRMRKVARAHQANPLPARPQVQVFRQAFPACGPGIFGMDMQIADQTLLAPF